VTGGKWEDGKSLEYNAPTYVSRYCGLISAENLKNHRGGREELGGKFAVDVTFCKTNDCNGGVKLGHSIGIILPASLLLAIHFLGSNF